MTESPKNPMPHHRLNHHQLMYKSPINMADIRKKSSNETTVPNEAALEPLSWRSAYKKRCLEESKKSRQKLLHKFRNIQLTESENKDKLNVYLDQELQKIFIEEAKDMVSIDEAIEIYNSMRNEVFDMMLNEQLEQQDRDAESEKTQVVCPLCQKANLTMRNGEIRCENSGQSGCQLVADANQSGISDLDELARRLDEASQQHPCHEVPKFLFRFLDEDLENSLLIYCESCNYFRKIF